MLLLSVHIQTNIALFFIFWQTSPHHIALLYEDKCAYTACIYLYICTVMSICISYLTPLLVRQVTSNVKVCPLAIETQRGATAKLGLARGQDWLGDVGPAQSHPAKPWLPRWLHVRNKVSGCKHVGREGWVYLWGTTTSKIQEVSQVQKAIVTSQRCQSMIVQVLSCGTYLLWFLLPSSWNLVLGSWAPIPETSLLLTKMCNVSLPRGPPHLKHSEQCWQKVL